VKLAKPAVIPKFPKFPIKNNSLDPRRPYGAGVPRVHVPQHRCLWQFWHLVANGSQVASEGSF